jgi:signal transduction histidine kinase
VLLTLLPLFLVSAALSVYLSYRYQEMQAIEQLQRSSEAQATIIKESLVHMMVRNRRIDDEFLAGINQAGDVQNLQVWFSLDSLRLAGNLLTPDRLNRLRARELKMNPTITEYIDQGFPNGNALWRVECDIGQHTEHVTDVSVSRRPAFFHSCERLKMVLPFRADARCQQCHDVSEGAVLGAAYMEVPLKKTAEALRATAARSIWIFAAFVMIAIGSSAAIFRNFVTKPVHSLVEATKEIGSGNLNHNLPDGFGKDEIGLLADAFRLMQERLKSALSELVAKERLSAVGQMASQIVHDIRSPLSIALMGVDLFSRNGTSQAEHRELINHIRNSLVQMNRMAQEILEFSRGEMALRIEEHDVTHFLKEIVAEVENSLRKKGITFKVSQRYEGRAKFDAHRLHRSLVNLLMNAEDATPHGGEIRLESFREEGNLVFLVSDTGHGIPQEIQQTIFEPFVTSGKKSGTGLGLAITKEIVTKHGGTITFQSVAGKGTTFMVQLPVIDRDVERQPRSNLEQGITA